MSEDKKSASAKATADKTEKKEESAKDEKAKPVKREIPEIKPGMLNHIWVCQTLIAVQEVS